MRVSEICVKRIRVNQGLGVFQRICILHLKRNLFKVAVFWNSVHWDLNLTNDRPKVENKDIKIHAFT